jgi:hypothetical protein
MKKSKADYKAAMEYVLNACDKQEKITGAYLNKMFGVSLHFIPAMINAGYIVKGQSRKYRWKVQLGVLPIIVKRIQKDITDWNMRNINKSKSKSAVVPVEPEITPVEKTVFRVEPSTYKTVINSKEPVAKQEKPIVERGNQTIYTALLQMQDETIKAMKEEVKSLNEEIDELTNKLNSIPTGSSLSIRIFGLPIFSIARS